MKTDLSKVMKIDLSLETARKLYKEGGIGKGIAMLYFGEHELKQSDLPKTWKEFCQNVRISDEECMIAFNSTIQKQDGIIDNFRRCNEDRNLLPNEQEAEKHLILMQLHTLRDYYNKLDDTYEEEINFSNSTQLKYTIQNYGGVLDIVKSIHCSRFLSFKSEKFAKIFLDSFHDLIKKVDDLI